MGRPVRLAVTVAQRLILTAALCAAVVYPTSAADIERQRALFQTVYETAERGDWSAFDALSEADRQALKGYVLWPDLRAAYLRATISSADHVEIEAFLDRFGVLKPARELRYRYALDLAAKGEFARYHDIYRTFYQGLEIATLDCLALQAEIAVGAGLRVVNRAKALWRVGRSQVDECDPVFEFMKANGHLDARDYVERYDLAIDAREFALARWLGRSIDEAHVENARLWLAVQANPERFLRSHASRANSPAARERLVYAIERITYADPDLADEQWTSLVRRHRFTEEQKATTARHIALWTARDNLDNAYARLTRLPTAAQDDEVMRWRARSSLRSRNWTNLLNDIRGMSAAEKSTEEWRYWRAVALHESGQVNAARSQLEALAAERSYYGFLAADAVGQPYAYENSQLAVDETMVDALAERPELIRARELFLVGLDGRGRSEWDAAVSYMSQNEKRHVAVLADRWSWHSRAIAAAASVGEYDDLALRYPLPYRGAFERYASAASIEPTWAYGIARSESLFMRDIRSSAGAIGLMQLMPSTGRRVAHRIKLPYAGIDTLTDPHSNIRLGTSYLGEMAERYDGNRVLATAAYNAGPHRVDRWRPERGTIDARIWIENIPFNETRSYVRRVMAAETIFHWRMNGSTRRLTELLADIAAEPGRQRVASASR